MSETSGTGEANRAEKTEKAEMSKGDKVKKEIIEWVQSLAMALVIFFIVRTFVFTVISVDGSSMETTLHDKERLIVSIFDMKLWGIQRGDPVICHYPERKENFVKRVVALPGDRLWMSGGVLYVNEEAVDEPYIAKPDMKDYGPWELGDDQYFVMGDNRNNSNDSRFVGPIKKDMIIGKVQFVMWPMGSMRTID